MKSKDINGLFEQLELTFSLPMIVWICIASAIIGRVIQVVITLSYEKEKMTSNNKTIKNQQTNDKSIF